MIVVEKAYLHTWGERKLSVQWHYCVAPELLLELYDENRFLTCLEGLFRTPIKYQWSRKLSAPSVPTRNQIFSLTESRGLSIVQLIQ